MVKRSKNGNLSVIENDAALVWAYKKCIVTGADLFDRLLYGIKYANTQP